MLKIIYESEPFYSDNMINDPTNTKLEVVFEPDSGTTEIIAKMIDILQFMGYPKPSKLSWEHMMDALIWDGKIEDDLKEEGEN